jgi:tRNA threonylcarbamoyl adenosine modification protein YeaZ
VNGPVLAIEASSLAPSLALAGPGEEPLGHWQAPEGARGTAMLAAAAAELLDAAGLKAADLMGVVVGTGPGSYTGTRAAIALARGIAFPGGLPIAGVPSVAAAARAALREDPQLEHVVVLIDARRGEVYRADYTRAGASEGPIAQEEQPPRLVAEADAEPAADASTGAGLSVIREPVPDAYDVAALGRERLAAGGDDPAGVRPLYLKRAHAEIVFDERVGGTPGLG